MNKPILTSFLVACLIIISGLLTGCTSNNKKEENTFVTYPVFSNIDLNILNQVNDEYQSLKQTLSYDEARNQLLEKLNNTEGVETAELGLDGYTIFITFSDGDFAGVDTYEQDEIIPYEPETNTPQFSILNNEVRRSPSYNHDSRNLGGVSFNSYTEPNKKITPSSKKILILGPCYYDFNTEPFQESIEYFKDHGWTDDDIVKKVVDYKSGLVYQIDYGALKPEDFFDLEEYGIIFYTGHGITHIYNNFNEDNIYLQFCFITNETYTSNPDIKKWKDQRKILVFKEHTQLEGDEEVDWYTTCIRADVLREELKMLPDSYMHLSTCYGAYFKDVFLDNGAKMFLGWTDKTNGDIADENMLDLNKLMLDSNYCLNDAYNDDKIQRLIDWPYSEFNIYTDETSAENFYFPAWLDLMITSIPNETDYLRSSVYDTNSDLIREIDDKLEFSSTQIISDGLANLLLDPAEEIRIEVKAFDSSGQELASGKCTIMLDAGANYQQVALSSSKTYKYILSGGPDKNDLHTVTSAVCICVYKNYDEVNETGEWYAFCGGCVIWEAKPGDTLRLTWTPNWYSYECHSFGPIWLHRDDDPNKKIKLCDAQDFGCKGYTDEPFGFIETVFDQTWVIPDL